MRLPLAGADHSASFLGGLTTLRLLCQSLAQKMRMLTTVDAVPTSLKQRALNYMKYRCSQNELHGVQQAAFRLNCSARQLQRLLNQYEAEGVVTKTRKGAYKLTARAWEPSASIPAKGRAPQPEDTY